MKKIGLFLVAAPLFFLALGMGSRDPEQPGPRSETIVTITGTLRLVGNEPFTRYALRTEEGKDYFLFFKDEAVPEYAGSGITVTGTLSIRELKSADGKYTISEETINVLSWQQ